MGRFLVAQILVTAAAFSLTASPPSENQPATNEPTAIHSQAELNAAIARLKNETTRLIALEQLISFGWLPLYNPPWFITADAEQDRLQTQAADAIRKCNDFKTIRMALDSPSETLQDWALWNIPGQQVGDAERWNGLLPRIRRLATGKAAGIRGRAQECLRGFDNQEEFLAKCIESETCLDNLLRPLYDGNGQGFHDRFNPHVLRLLNHKEEEVRCNALGFIGFNSHRAPMWQIRFDDKVFQRVLELSRSKNISDRNIAVCALADFRSREPEAVRKRMIELATDESENVRWQIPGTLIDQMDREDVRTAMAQLLRDKAPIVRYFTIAALGPDKYMKELEELASGSDKQIAQWAAERLQGLKSKKQ